MAALTRIVYVAEFERSATEIELHAMLAAARIHNRRLDITGLMVRSARHIAHVLEGRAASLATLMDWAGREPLHRHVRIVACAPLARRRFDNWAVAIVRGYDLANDIAELHQTGGLQALAPEQVLDHLVASSADELVLRMHVNAPRPPQPRAGADADRRLR
jgi:hypothetical protein